MPTAQVEPPTWRQVFKAGGLAADVSRRQVVNDVVHRGVDDTAKGHRVERWVVQAVMIWLALDQSQDVPVPEWVMGPLVPIVVPSAQPTPVNQPMDFDANGQATPTPELTLLQRRVTRLENQFEVADRRAKIHDQQIERLNARFEPRTVAPMGAKHVLQPTGSGLAVWRLSNEPGDTGKDQLVGTLTPEHVLALIRLLTINPTFIDRPSGKPI